MSCIKIISKSKPLGKYARLFGKKAKINVYNKNDIRLTRKSEKWKYNMISIWYGDDKWGPISAQHKMSVRFLSRYGKIIDMMRKQEGRIDAFIDYPTINRLNDKIAVQQDEIPLSLIEKCAQHGVSINIATYS